MMRLAVLFLLASALWAQRFPKPNPEQAFRELKVFTGGSPLRTPKEDWSRARKMAASGSWKDWVGKRRAEVDEWMAKRQDRVEWVAGWHHDFVSPKDGSFLEWTPEVPGEYLTSPSDPQVTVTPTLFAAWVYRFRSAHTSRIEEAAMLFRLTGERKYSDWVASQLDFYGNNYEKWPVQTRLSKSRIMAQSLDEAVVLIKFVNAARLIQAAASEEQKARWYQRLFRPEAELLDETFQRIHNISCWQRSAQAHVALLYRDEALWKKAIDGPFGIRKQVAEGVTSDYIWFEQSLGYNSYVVSALLPIFTYASLEGRGEELRHEMAVIQNLMLAPVMMRFPNGQLPNPADITGGPGRAPSTRSIASAYRVFPTAIVAPEQGQSWSTLVDPAEAPAKLAALPPPQSWNMESSRMAIVRKGNWQVYLHYGQLDRSHAQAEALNYEACYGTTCVTHDPGTVGYGSPLHREYYTKAWAHNVPTIGGEGQESWKHGELLRFDPSAGVVAGRQPEYRKDVSAQRELKIDGERLIDTVEVQPQTSQPLGLLLHLNEPVEWKGDPAACPPHWTGCRKAGFRDQASFTAGRMRVTVQVAGPFTITYGSAPDVPPQRNQGFYIEAGSRERATFRTVIEPLK